MECGSPDQLSVLLALFVSFVGLIVELIHLRTNSFTNSKTGVAQTVIATTCPKIQPPTGLKDPRSKRGKHIFVAYQ